MSWRWWWAEGGKRIRKPFGAGSEKMGTDESAHSRATRAVYPPVDKQVGPRHTWGFSQIPFTHNGFSFMLGKKTREAKEASALLQLDKTLCRDMEYCPLKESPLPAGQQKICHPEILWSPICPLLGKRVKLSKAYSAIILQSTYVKEKRNLY